MKRLMLVWVIILCLVPLGGWAEVEPVEWFTGSGEVYNSLGEHYCFVVEDDHAVLTDYRVDSDADQPAIVHVPDAFDGVQLTVIGSNAFNNYGGSYDGTKVECIAIPEGVVTLRSDAFQCAHDVRRIELPSTLERIDGYPFHHVHADISFPDGNQFYQVNDGFLVDTRTDGLIYCSASSASLPLPRVSRVEDWALENYSPYQVTLEFPDSVTFIGANNAYDCVDIETIIVPGSVVELADEALRVNTATEIILNEGLRRIGAFAFEQTEITSISIPSTVEWIGWCAFFLTEVEDQDLGLTCQIETEEEYEIRSSWPDEEDEVEANRWNEEDEEYEDWLDEADAETLIIRLETLGLTEVSAQLDQTGLLSCVLVSGRDTGTNLRVVLRITPCAMGVYVGDETGDVAQIPVSRYDNYLRTPGTEIPEQAEQLVQSELTLAQQRQQTRDSMPVLTGYIGKFPKNKRYDVYRGPGKSYGRGSGGKAYVSTNGPITCYGLRGDWMLISYEITGGEIRYGWISTDDLPRSTVDACPQLVFPGDDGTDYLYAVIAKPSASNGLGQSVHCLAEVPRGILFEAYAKEERTFNILPARFIDMEHGCVYYLKMTIPEETWHTEEDIRSAMEAVSSCYAACAPGCSLMSLTYLPDDNLPENADWPTDVPEGIEWMKLRGTVHSIAYYDFEMAGPDGTAEDLVFYVWREPGGEWIGGLGGYE